MNAGPWLPVPPHGYGGIENIVATLVPELRALGIEVVLATVGESTLPADEHVHAFGTGQFAMLQRPYNQACGVVPAHQAAVLRRVAAGDIDLIHDHVEAAGLAMLAALDLPGLHTLHWDLRKHPDLYGTFDGGARVRVNGVSADQLTHAPAALRAHAIGHVHLATPLAIDADKRQKTEKHGYAVVLGRINPGKGQDLAARLAHRHGFDLVLAGPVGPYHSPEALAAADPQNPDVRFWHEQVAPHVDGVRVRWVGTVAGQERDDLVAGARAALFPLRWNEPGGTAVVESLALGTPVVGIARGCLPELIEHGRTGLLTTDEDELGELMHAVGGLTESECRAEAARRFTPAVMAAGYAQLYERMLTP
ncbi:glycosyltransferase [Catenuloplanes indicus]|uniref:Glycosyltransferase involved in cell wall biosynthesis n=1 Tax=Catenuloplanes indicus TaxID=137267 RepID=A0AAE3VWF3_9ACTN|nr:glycosyltransferase [Catenuloplanes indicus]MDQ0365258.1 glycosyltransferase involved in cell wall biosynthesis [Catenuloplanes indicus]